MARATRTARLTGDAGVSLAELLVVVAILAFTVAAVYGVHQVIQRSTLSGMAAEDAQLQARAILDRIVLDMRLIAAGRATKTGAITAADATSITFEGDIDTTPEANGSAVRVGTLDATGQLDVAGTSSVAAGATSVTLTDAVSISCGSTLTLTDGPIAESLGVAATNCKDASNPNRVTLTSATSTSYPVGTLVTTPEKVSYNWYGVGSGILCRKLGADCPTAPPASGSDDIVATGVTSFKLSYYASGSTTPMTTIDLGAIRAIEVEISIRSQVGDQAFTRMLQATVRPRNLF